MSTGRGNFLFLDLSHPIGKSVQFYPRIRSFNVQNTSRTILVWMHFFAHWMYAAFFHFLPALWTLKVPPQPKVLSSSFTHHSIALDLLYKRDWPRGRCVTKTHEKNMYVFLIVDPPEASVLESPEIFLAHLVELSKAHPMACSLESEKATNTPINSFQSKCSTTRTK